MKTTYLGNILTKLANIMPSVVKAHRLEIQLNQCFPNSLPFNITVLMQTRFEMDEHEESSPWKDDFFGNGDILTTFIERDTLYTTSEMAPKRHF